MQRLLIAAVAPMVLLGLSATASADRGDRHWDGDRHWGRGHGYAPRHVHGSRTGVYLNLGPLWWPGYYPGYYYPYYAPSTVIVAPPAPTTYVQTPAEGSGYWYYCQSPQGYYPYVRSCPGGWMKVVPDTPGN